MGIGKILNKKVKKLPRVMIAAATFEKWEEKPAEEVKEFAEKMVEQIKKDHPLYKYEKSVFEYTANGNIDFKFRFILIQSRSCLTVVR